ncbi:MAG: nucleotidyltransferase domain-containing protein [Deltaproteobacteria bacterium]|nr:nucleotidyltransferase domain-containing protein [Candidatus Tharpella aukensis]
MAAPTIDLPADAIRQLVDIVSSYPEINRLLVFGSRALGNAKAGSDVDLAVVGEKVTPQIVTAIHYYLEEETVLPYFFDVIHFESIDNPALRKHIINHGKIIYQR